MLFSEVVGLIPARGKEKENTFFCTINLGLGVIKYIHMYCFNLLLIEK